ncbi:hypothetical protein ES702_06823 [subsurface metagenome]
MTTLMTFKTKKNKKGKCNTKCYDAEQPKCVCCCGGRNHGVGFEKAFQNTIDHFEEMKKNNKSVKKNARLFEEFDFLKKQFCLFHESKKGIISRLKD